MSHLWNQGHYDELSPECQTCQHRKTVTVYMNGKHAFGCGKYPLRVGEKCPKFEQEEDEWEKVYSPPASAGARSEG